MGDELAAGSPASLPAPLTPADCDLTCFNYMRLDVRRLRDSKIAVSTTGDEFRAAVLLWCASWHQVPAASLPDDDIELSQLAGYGRVIREWKKVRAGALHGWIKCSDGRLYHPIVAEKAIEAWNERREHTWQRECDRLRKENKRREAAGLPLMDIPERPSRISYHPGDGIPADGRMNSDGIPPENALKYSIGRVHEYPGTSLRSVSAGKLEATEHTAEKTKSKADIRHREIFESSFWSSYPRKKNKGAAETAWNKAVRDTPPEVIVAGLARAKWHADKQFIPYPATWLNAKGWLDESPPEPARQEGLFVRGAL
jgi:hypothetical protein